jgi:serine protease Do
MSQNAPATPNQGPEPNILTCANCHSPMPSGLRFCRNCGYRLGEGSAEYTETVRFQDTGAGTPPVAPKESTSSKFETTYGLSSGPMVAAKEGQIGRRCPRRIGGMSWLFIALIIFFVAAGAFTTLVRHIRRNIPIQVPIAGVSRSYFGVNSFDTTDGGVTFENVEPPGSPADKAGLVGGDLITTFDGQPVKTDDEMMDLLASTPIGKSVDIVFLRDGETKTTKLTTISKEDFDRLVKSFRERPEGKGQFGYDDDETEKVEVPNTKIHGVRLDQILQSRPADLAGIKEGDIAIEFDGAPIRTPEELQSRILRAIPYSTVRLIVMRDNQRLEIPVKMGKQ